MNHRERVATALAHETPDRCPIEMSFTPEFAARLRAYLGDAAGGHHNPHGGGNTHQLERALDLDVLLTSVGWANSYYAGEVYNPGSETYTDEWGVGWRNIEYETRFGKGAYTEMCTHPLADDDAIERYQAPDPHRPGLFEGARATIGQFGADYWICGSVQTTIFETATALRGYERILMDMVANPDLLDRLFEIPHAYHKAVASRLVELGVDMIWLGDDLGGQHNMIIAPEVWRERLKPRLADIVAHLKAINPGLKVAYHTDGYVEPVIGDLIEVGVDVLNPVQPACMDPAVLKKRFGRNLAYMGTVDEQQTLPFGATGDVRREVRLRLETVGAGGGLIIGPTHHVQLDTPVENILALLEAVKEG